MESQKTPNSQNNPKKEKTKSEASYVLVSNILQSYNNQNSMVLI